MVQLTVKLTMVLTMVFTVMLTVQQGTAIGSYQHVRSYNSKSPRDRTNGALTKKSSTFDIFRYHRHGEINNYLDSLAYRYPGLVQVSTIGRSTEGRDLKLINISRRDNRNGSNPIIWIDGGFHAREWISPAMAVYAIHQLVEEPSNSQLLDGVDWSILPVVNPDGYEYTHTNDRYWRKTRSYNNGSQCRGVDPNRNFAFHFNEVGSSSNPCDQTYNGGRPFTEPETSAVRDYIWANKAIIVTYLTLHSFGSAFLYPWGHTTELPRDWRDLDVLAQAANDAQVKAGGKKYMVGAVSSYGYQFLGSGGSDDWAKGKAGIKFSYTIELYGGTYGFTLPERLIKPVVKPMFEALRVFGNYAKLLLPGG